MSPRRQAGASGADARPRHEPVVLPANGAAWGSGGSRGAGVRPAEPADPSRHPSRGSGAPTRQARRACELTAVPAPTSTGLIAYLSAPASTGAAVCMRAVCTPAVRREAQPPRPMRADSSHADSCAGTAPLGASPMGARRPVTRARDCREPPSAATTTPVAPRRAASPSRRLRACRRAGAEPLRRRCQRRRVRGRDPPATWRRPGSSESLP